LIGRQLKAEKATLALSELKTGFYVIPAEAGIHTGALDYRRRGNDDPRIKVHPGFL
jgi:hypothetical protein